MKLRFLLIISIFIGWLSAAPVWAYVMSSTNYYLQFDSVNIGGKTGTSTSYKIEDTTGEVASGLATSTNYRLYGGYQQLLYGATLSLTIPTAVSLSSVIPGLSGGTSSGTAQLGVMTDNTAGYSLNIVASASPALTSGANNFGDYTAVGANPDFSWSVSSTDSEFGFTVEGTDLVQKFLDNGSSCNVGSSDTSDSCWFNLSTTALVVSQSAAPNSPNTTTTTLKLQAQSGTQHVQPNGSYTATITITAYLN